MNASSSLGLLLIFLFVLSAIYWFVRRPSFAHTGEIIHLGTLEAGSPLASIVTVYNRDTGDRPQLVQSVNVEEGWIRQYVVQKGTRRLIQDGDDFMVRKIYGNWGLLPKEPLASRHRKTYSCVAFNRQFFTWVPAAGAISP